MGQTIKRNQEVRQAAKDAGVPLYKLAQLFGVTEWTFTRKLREELPPEDKERALSFIRELAGGGYND